MTDANLERRPRIVKSHDVRLDSEYAEWIGELKWRYRSAQTKAAVKVNSEQLLFNWQLGRDLVAKKVEEKWGSGVVEQVSLDLKAEFPDAKGFSTTNLWYMKKWYLFYSSDGCFEVLQQLVGELEEASPTKLQRPIGEIDSATSEAVVPFPQVFAFVPWGHHIDIITRCKSIDEAVFYICRTIREGLNRNALDNAMRADLYHGAGRAQTNFDKILPSAQGKLAQEITKDTYDFGFISLPEEYGERDLENALEQNITRFLLELGMGFAFVGRQVEVIVSGKTRRVDLLFYHIRLRCYVVVELKARAFEPEFAGKLNFYVNAIDDLMKAAEDNPTIGLLICKEKDAAEVQWAFRGIGTPMGVATYDNVQVEEIQKHLPSEEQIRQRIEQAEREFMAEFEESKG